MVDRRKHNDGTQLQDAVWRALQEIQKHHECFVHRFTDSKASRNLVGAQPSDYMAVFGGTPFLLECKSTCVGASIRKLVMGSAGGKRQLAKAKQFIRAGGRGFFIWHDSLADTLLVYVAGEWASPLLGARRLADAERVLLEVLEGA